LHININNKIARELQMLREARERTSQTTPPSLPEKAQAVELNKPDKIDWEALKPFPKIPNCREFSIELGEVDKLFKHFGIDKKTPPKVKIEGYTNGPFIRYYVHQILRLQGEKDDTKY